MCVVSMCMCSCQRVTSSLSSGFSGDLCVCPYALITMPVSRSSTYCAALPPSVCPGRCGRDGVGGGDSGGMASASVQSAFRSSPVAPEVTQPSLRACCDLTREIRYYPFIIMFFFSCFHHSSPTRHQFCLFRDKAFKCLVF